MSKWIHVAGNIRFDSMSIGDKRISNKEQKDIKKVLGTIPSGSEGELEIQIIDIKPPEKGKYGTISYSARYGVLITGDLRDVDDFQQIEKWVKEIKQNCIKYNMWIRQGVIMAKNDYSRSKTWEMLTIYKNNNDINTTRRNGNTNTTKRLDKRNKTQKNRNNNR